MMPTRISATCRAVPLERSKQAWNAGLFHTHINHHNLKKGRCTSHMRDVYEVVKWILGVRSSVFVIAVDNGIRSLSLLVSIRVNFILICIFFSKSALPACSIISIYYNTQRAIVG
jgi:hypothetical protein